jgi:hypothetical protein
MTYREFKKWCNERACDGYWGLREAIICGQIIGKINDTPFLKRKKVWLDMEQDVLDNIVTPTNNLIELTLARLNDDR